MARQVCKGNCTPKRKPGKASKAVAKINSRMSASASAAPRVQPTAGQLISAGIIKGN